jgi:hypothetical protein
MVELKKTLLKFILVIFFSVLAFWLFLIIYAVYEILKNNHDLLDGIEYHQELNFLESVKDEISAMWAVKAATF